MSPLVLRMTVLATLVFSIRPYNLNYYVLGVALWLFFGHFHVVRYV